MYKPLLAITMGDPAGIGPEVIIKAFLSGKFTHSFRPLVIGDKKVMDHYLQLLAIHDIKTVAIRNPDEWTDGVIPVLEQNALTGDWSPGVISANCGEAAFRYIDKSIELAKANVIDAAITCPINKEAMKLAGYNYPGHTEIYAEKTDTEDFTMMFKLKEVAVVHVTTHCSLREAIELVQKERVLTNIKLLNKSLQSLGIEKPEIAVAGLNPHAGENGLFGTEDMEQIVPAIEEAREMGISASGPYPPDTVFMKAFKGEFHGVVAMLHDHGFVALKSLDFESGVNITVGLPIIRTSVGHGTAFDISGKNRASESSLLAAIDAAEKMAHSRIANQRETKR